MSIRLLLLLSFIGLALTNIGESQVYENVVDFGNSRSVDVADKGRKPEAALAEDSEGNLYGTTEYGGAFNLGTVFRINPAGELTTLFDFDSISGAYPRCTLARGPDGSFYGTTRQGGAMNMGTVFKVTPGGSVISLLHFTDDSGPNRGANPNAGLYLASDRNFYGTTTFGGTANLGTIYRVTPAGVLNTLVEFTGTAGLFKGSRPYGSLIEGADGNLYGTTEAGGANDFGTVFRITPAGVLTTLVEFTGNGAADKSRGPLCSLTLGADGLFYGTTKLGGTSNLGTVFNMTSAGALTTLVNFAGATGANRGSYPCSGLVATADGTLYGRRRREVRMTSARSSRSAPAECSPPSPISRRPTGRMWASSPEEGWRSRAPECSTA